jgi:hypothetical protein
MYHFLEKYWLRGQFNNELTCVQEIFSSFAPTINGFRRNLPETFLILPT